MRFPLAISAAGALLMLVSAILLALPASGASPLARGGHAVAPKTTNAPLLPKQKRGVVRVHQTVRAVLTLGPDGLAYRKP